MFHVFQVVSLGFSRNSSKFQNLYREEAWNFPMSLRLYEELESIWMESSDFFQDPRHLYYVRRLTPCFAFLSPRSNTWDDSQNFSKSHSLHGGRAWNFSKSQSLCGGRAWNVRKFQSLYRGGENVYHYL